jgi:hypothetical protein
MGGGVIGLLCADDGRDSYDLDSMENERLRRDAFLRKDGVNYFKTDMRYEKIRFLDPTLSLFLHQDTLVFFTHEWALLPPKTFKGRLFQVITGKFLIRLRTRSHMERSIEWLKTHGYDFSFLEESQRNRNDP